jgi:hypothetical protein
MTSDPHVYSKHNSFGGFRGHAADDSGLTLAKIAVALDEPNNSKQRPLISSIFLKVSKLTYLRAVV